MVVGMGGDGPKALAFPVAFPEVPAFLVEIQSTRNEAHHNLGLPHLTNWVDGLGECDFWAYEYRCGLQVVYQFLHDGQGGSALADSPEVNHVIRHSPFRQDLCFPITQEGLNLELDRLLSAYPFRAPEIALLDAFQVQRQDDNGNTYAVGDPTSERDARCWAEQLESFGHKQSYWYTRIGSPPRENGA